jgi:hypothetical protein
MAKSLRIEIYVGLTGIAVAGIFCTTEFILEVGFPDWAVFVWPSIVLFIGLSGYYKPETFLAFATAASLINGLLYFLTTWILLRVVRTFRKRDGKD